jgi:hypothetical protein
MQKTKEKQISFPQLILIDVLLLLGKGRSDLCPSYYSESNMYHSSNSAAVDENRIGVSPRRNLVFSNFLLILGKGL